MGRKLLRRTSENSSFFLHDVGTLTCPRAGFAASSWPHREPRRCVYTRIAHTKLGGDKNMGNWVVTKTWTDVDSMQGIPAKKIRGGPTVATISVRYIVHDVDAAIAFYTERLGFGVELSPAPGFAVLSRGELRLLLNEPGAGGAGQPMPDGRKPEPGGWNRIQLEVDDLAGEVEALREAGAHFRNEIVSGRGGKQILLEDPSGNPIELFEPPSN